MPHELGTASRLRWPMVIWAVVILVVCVRSAVSTKPGTLGQLWKHAGQAWIEGRPLFRPDLDPRVSGFRYGPPVAGLLAPLGLMPAWSVEVVWRLLNAGVLLGGMAWWLTLACPRPGETATSTGLHLIAAALSLASLNNGQVNCLMAGLFLLGLAAIAQERWNVAALSLAGLAWLKVYPFMACVLLMILYPRKLAPRLLAALAILGTLPFALQGPGYVAAQYAEWFALLAHNDVHRRFLPLVASYRDLFALLRVWGLVPDLRAYALLQLATAAGCAWLCWAGSRRGEGAPALLWRVLFLGTSWMLLLGPATESSTYSLCAVPLAWWMIHVHQAGPASSRYLAAGAVGLLLLCVLSTAVPAGSKFYQASGLQPLAMLLWLASWTAAPPAGTESASQADPRSALPLAA